MPSGSFDPTATTATATTATASSFPGSGLTTAQTDAEYRLNRVLAHVPIIMAGSKRVPPGTEDFNAHVAAAAPTIMTYDQSLDNFYAIDDASRAELASKLLDAGFYPKTYYGKRPPVFDAQDDALAFNAYKKVVQQAARSQTAVIDIINTRAKERAAAGLPTSADIAANGGNGAPFSPVLTNPDDLRAVIKAGATAHLGQKVSDAEVDKIIAAYQQQQTAAQQSAYDNQLTGGASNASASPQAFVEQQLRAAHPDMAIATDFNNAADQMLQAVRSAPHQI